ncbi:probable citrate synthase 2, mitochondrial [Venturia canescens]|uniref:probable citrate synthase 2, mitochondrial n=1 Tax=Venturia canescens TaxID=32260 RepID=UPI001C9C52F0|nr:probable citrate synthase 2, mitochondrial [Venturia canescens]
MHEKINAKNSVSIYHQIFVSIDRLLINRWKRACNNCGGAGRCNRTKVSTTRGTPSPSIDLKEAVREKIPLHYDLLRKLRSQHGSTVISRITIDDIYEGLKGVNTLVRETCEADSTFGLRYRGLTLSEVLALLPRHSNAPSPEAVFWLLLTGDVPTYEQTASLVEDWNLRRQRQKKWWLQSGDGSFVGRIFKAFPKYVTPLTKLSVVLSAFNATEKGLNEIGTTRNMSYDSWEKTYEEGMELLAILPGMVGLTRDADRGIEAGFMKFDEKRADWVDFLLENSGLLSNTIDDRKKASFGDFLRLYIVANADEDGGIPSTHVTQILGASRLELSKTLAAGVLAYSNEPNTGTMSQYMDFQKKIQNVLGHRPSGEALKDLVSTLFVKESEIIGHKETPISDSRYAAFSDFARENMNEEPDIKLSRDITRILTAIANSSGKNLWPEQSAIAAPIFQLYGLKNMEFNQTLLWMSRALGTVASIIWTRATDIPPEHPKSQSTYTYVNLFENSRKNAKP